MSEPLSVRTAEEGRSVYGLFRSSTFLSLFAQNILFFTSLNIFTVIPDWLETLGASRSYIGLFNNLNSLALVLLVVPLSAWIDRVGRKRMLVIGYSLALPSLALMFLVPDHLVGLLSLKLGSTLVFCVAFMVHQAEAFELVPPQSRVAGVALFGVSGLLSNPIASVLGEVLLEGPGARWVFLAAVAFMGASLVLCLLHSWHRPHEPPQRGAFLRLASRRQLRVLIVLTLCFGGAFTIYATFLANLTQQVLGRVSISPFFTAFTVVAVAGRLTIASWLDRIDRRLLVVACLALVSLSFLLSPLLGPQTAWLLLLMGGCYGIAHSILFPVLSTLFVDSGKADEKLALSSLFASVNTLGNFGFAIVLGALGDLLGLMGIFLAMGIVSAVASAIAFFRRF